MSRSRAIDYARFDEVKVLRTLAGHLPFRGLTYAERAEVVRRAASAGYSDGQTAVLLDCPRRSVLRIRQRRGIPSAFASDGDNRLRVAAPTKRDR